MGRRAGGESSAGMSAESEGLDPDVGLSAGSRLPSRAAVTGGRLHIPEPTGKRKCISYVNEFLVANMQNLFIS